VLVQCGSEYGGDCAIDTDSDIGSASCSDMYSGMDGAIGSDRAIASASDIARHIVVGSVSYVYSDSDHATGGASGCDNDSGIDIDSGCASDNVMACSHIDIINDGYSAVDSVSDMYSDIGIGMGGGVGG